MEIFVILDCVCVVGSEWKRLQNHIFPYVEEDVCGWTSFAIGFVLLCAKIAEIIVFA